MSLIVETGTASASSEAYASVTFADAYHLSIGNAAWALLATSRKEECLRISASYMCQEYRLQWKGVRVSASQSLDWPRYYVELPDSAVYAIIDPATVPIAVQQANAELALIASTEVLNPNRTQSMVSKQVGPIKVVYDSTSPTSKRYSAVDAMLQVYLANSSGGMNHKLRRC
jgi:hypothetical protein